MADKPNREKETEVAFLLNTLKQTGLNNLASESSLREVLEDYFCSSTTVEGEISSEEEEVDVEAPGPSARSSATPTSDTISTTGTPVEQRSAESPVILPVPGTSRDLYDSDDLSPPSR